MTLRACVVVVLFMGAIQARPAPPSAQAPARVPGLGTISFPNSGAAAAQPAFVRGVLLLHSFEFEAAAEAFVEAQKIDPGFALAYWGEAMTYNHPLWQQQDRDAAIRALLKLGPAAPVRAARAPTERERLYLAAVEALYGEGSKRDRDQAYMRAMEKLQAAYPADHEARAFHALAILGSVDGVRDFDVYRRAAAVAQPVFDANPDHPGAAHYLIHAYDDPVHAPLGLPAARKYADIAPGAAHAQHMTSHIFVAIGMWDDVIAANVRAMETQDADNARRGRPPNVCGHYSSWLQYGYLMKGETTKAAAMMDKCHARLSASPTRGEVTYFVQMRARQIVDTEDWALASKWTWTPDAAQAPANVFAYGVTNALAALRRGDAELAQRLLARPVPDDDTSKIHAQELRGALALHGEVVELGISELRAAAKAEDALAFEFGPPFLVKPAFELLGEELLKLGRKDEAAAAFKRALERTPGRKLASPFPAR